MSDSRRECLLAEIAAEEARIAALSAERARAEERLGDLRSQLSFPSAASAEVSPDQREGDEVSPHLSPAEKVSLFRSLFRGRADVFATLWNNG